MSEAEDRHAEVEVRLHVNTLMATERGRRVAEVLSELLHAAGGTCLDHKGQYAILRLLIAAWSGKVGTVFMLLPSRENKP